MLLQSSHHLDSDQPSNQTDINTTTNNVISILSPTPEAQRYLELVQSTLKEEWTVHTTKDGRLYYCNHITRTAGWLPPAESWGHSIDYPYGWEKAIDGKGRTYYINHLNKTTTYEAPICYRHDEKPPEPRLVVLSRNPKMGFGFVAGSERPVIVRFVTEGGPSVDKLEPGDRILAVNGEDVKDAPRDHVIQLVRSCDTQVNLLVCQPAMSICAGRKSTLLSAGKRAKLRSRPSRVRFAESVCVNGAPLFPPSAFSLGDLCVPQMANVLKVFLENGQTKSFKYDTTTTVQDVVTSLRDKLCLKADEYFSLVLEHVKSLKRNKLTLLDPQETLARIAARPGAHKLRCLFRVSFVPASAALLAQKDLNSLDYLYMQCCNDVTQERFAPELQPDVALRLAALHIHQHSLANNISPAKLTVKTVEREFGLERFVPSSLIESMKRKELRRLIAHFLKLNSQMTGSSSKMLTQLQAKIHYLDIISGLPSYGAKCFSTNQRDGIERVLLISPRFGLSQIAGVRNSVPQPISSIESLKRVVIIREDDVTHRVSVFIQEDRFITFSMEDRDAIEFANVLAGYHYVLTGKPLHVEKEAEEEMEEMAPPYLSQHSILPATWSYLPTGHGRTQLMTYLEAPPYQTSSVLGEQGQCDRNMNTTLTNKNHQAHNGVDEFGFDIHSVMTMEIMEGTKGKPINVLVEARNEEVMRRVTEMQKMVESSEKYLNEQGDLLHEFDVKPNARLALKDISDLDSDCDSMSSSKQSSNEDAQASGVLKHSDSLVLLAESINLDLNGITKGLNLIGATNGFESLVNELRSQNQEGTPKVQRKVQGLSQLLSNLQALSNDCSQSESDSESLYTPNSSPIHRTNSERNRQKNLRTSFGLHSPDNPADSKDTNLKEYLKQLKEASNTDNADVDLAAKKLTELYGFEIGGDTFIDTDPDVIDLTAIPPPRTPDELDSLTMVSTVPSGFHDNGELEQFLAQVTIAPPTQKVTPAKELTPEEIMSYIIPPPPGLEDDDLDFSLTKPTEFDAKEESLYMNSISKPENDVEQVIEYPTVERKGPFSCCSKGKKDEPKMHDKTNSMTHSESVVLPPRRCEMHQKPVPPERPPKSTELQTKLSSPTHMLSTNTTRLNGGGTGVYYDTKPPRFFPHHEAFKDVNSVTTLASLPPRKPNPPIPLKPTFRSPLPLPKLINADSRVIGSPRMNRYIPTNGYAHIDVGNTNGIPPIPAQRNLNGHYRSFSDCPPIYPKEPTSDSNMPITLLCSPQMSRKIVVNGAAKSPSINGSPILESRNGHTMSVDNLMAKTDVAMAGLLIKLDQIAAQCSVAQAAGGGSIINEEKFQNARKELTDQVLNLTTASKSLVMSMSSSTLVSLPEHLTSCLTALRRITELAQDMTRHTSSPLQTRNIVLKVHDVVANFRDLSGVPIGPFGAAPLALQAECLANVLSTLLRSLTVFSP